ncbi:hypothetical protein H6F61_03625 [Cyanobacteria bacterium FACHB-472]|nr:hypothetical protein [Cyanobacteria bacterium FACHB-472]
MEITVFILFIIAAFIAYAIVENQSRRVVGNTPVKMSDGSYINQDSQVIMNVKFDVLKTNSSWSDLRITNTNITEVSIAFMSPRGRDISYWRFVNFNPGETKVITDVDHVKDYYHDGRHCVKSTVFFRLYRRQANV